MKKIEFQTLLRIFAKRMLQYFFRATLTFYEYIKSFGRVTELISMCFSLFSVIYWFQIYFFYDSLSVKTNYEDLEILSSKLEIYHKFESLNLSFISFRIMIIFIYSKNISRLIECFIEGRIFLVFFFSFSLIEINLARKNIKLKRKYFYASKIFIINIVLKENDIFSFLSNYYCECY